MIQCTKNNNTCFLNLSDIKCKPYPEVIFIFFFLLDETNFEAVVTCKRSATSILKQSKQKPEIKDLIWKCPVDFTMNLKTEFCEWWLTC